MIRVLHVVTHMNRGGLETMIMNYYRNIDKKKIQFDFLVHRMERAAYDEEIETLGGYIHRLPVLNPFSLKYRKKLNNFFKEHPEYQIVHVHQDCLSSIILKAAKKNGVRVRIAHNHNANQDKNIKYFIKIFYMQFIPHYATALMACGQAAGDWMFQGKNYTILNNAINCEEYAFNAKKRKDLREQLNIIKDELIIGHKGNYPILAKMARKLPVFPEVINERSMLHIDNLCEFLCQIMLIKLFTLEAVVLIPQNPAWTKTSDMVKKIAEVSGKRIITTKLFTPAIKLCGKIPGEISDLVNKAFGNSTYALAMSQYEGIDYQVVDFEASIERTESNEKKG